ncbi:MAG: nucleoprotein/polynucleotide-associated enzyme [Cycloclasticus sp. symbiont of Bathymodiolus heckerae]|nr:MAG: nucleoprotein/polynucleotide-associated enzyme [Cycloclasticus sp. symbiont of Bathymodiolus heckerae]
MKNISLQDQLLKAGLTSKSKADKAKKQKNKQRQQQQKNKVEVKNEAAGLANAAKAKQLEKDRELNQKRNQQAEKNQISGQITQLINLNKLEKDDEGDAFNFTDDNKIKVIYVGDDLRNRLVSGRAVIVNLGKTYEVVSPVVAEKIAQRDAQRVIYLDDVETLVVDDEYADYAVPDDLMW